jgi:hypothetical protein
MPEDVMFDINNSRDFYQKLLSDFDDYMENVDSARHAMNCAITAYHMHDWVWNDYLKNDDAIRAKMGINKKLSNFQAWIFRNTVWFNWIEELANGSKHFGRKTSFETSRIGGFGMGPYGGGGYGESYLLIDNGEVAAESQYMSVAMLIEVVIRFWRDFLKNYSPYTDIPRGKTLLMDEQ